MVYILWVYVYWFVYKTHFRHTVALAPENVAVRGLNKMQVLLKVFKYKYTFTKQLWGFTTLNVIHLVISYNMWLRL